MELNKQTCPWVKRLVSFGIDGVDCELIVNVCEGHETVSALLSTQECALRTLLNLKNLIAVRGLVSTQNRLKINTAMTGPHHYYGYISPDKPHTIGLYPEPVFYEWQNDNIVTPPAPKLKIPDVYEFVVPKHAWKSHVLTEQSKDSLFKSPGILELPSSTLNMTLLENPTAWDLRSYKAQLVCNSEPFMFDQSLVARYRHAQHRLRVVTYNYGPRYLEEYVYSHSGIFLERHEFIQSITPVEESCGGYVMLGRYDHQHRLVLIALPITYGYTLLVDVGCIHGDSTMTGLHMMAMTGDHEAMNTADTVFLRHHLLKSQNVRIALQNTLPSSPPLTTATKNQHDMLIKTEETGEEQFTFMKEAAVQRVFNNIEPYQRVFWKPYITNVY
jgi:hypothetical protein